MGRARQTASRTVLPCVLLLAVLMALPMPSIADAQYCFDGNTLLSTTDVYNGSAWINTTTYSPCPNGCNNASYTCNQPLYNSDNQLLFFVFPFISLVLFLIGYGINDEDWAICLLFLISSLIFLVGGMGMMSTYVTMNASTVFSPTLYLFWFITIVLVCVLFYYALKTVVQAWHAVVPK